MVRRLFSYYSHRFVSKWLILLFDIVVVGFSLLLAYLLRFHIYFGQEEYLQLLIGLPVVGFSYLVGFVLFQSYAGVIRHTGVRDANKLFLACSLAMGMVVLSTLAFRNFKFIPEYNGVPHSITGIHFLISLFLLIASRFIVKSVYRKLRVGFDQIRDHKVLIYGAGHSGLVTRNTLEREDRRIQVQAFIDDNESLHGKMMDGLKVLNREEGKRLVQQGQVEEVILSIQNIDKNTKSQILNELLDLGTVVKNVPPVERWINGELSSNQIKEVSIDDLLERDEIILDSEKLHVGISEKTVLVTGAAGSIGSEIVRQLMRFSPSVIVLLDMAETPLHSLQLELEANPGFNGQLVYTIGDVRNVNRLQTVFERHHPNIVFHAAAYKHVPMMEENAAEAIDVNCWGTRHVADLAVKFGVERFVMISTDKAVNPTNVMGASKRLAEMYIQSLNKPGGTSFITTRFGNVLGSNGSVIPLFKEQIRKGGPVTVTHPEVTRYFMTIPEACQLVLEACVMGRGGEIYIFDMGESVKILDLAKKMIRLSGLTLGRDIEIVYTGLRPGEKLYEELLASEESTLPTYHPKIRIASVRPTTHGVVSSLFEEMRNNATTVDNRQWVTLLKSILPDFRSPEEVNIPRSGFSESVKATGSK